MVVITCDWCDKGLESKLGRVLSGRKIKFMCKKCGAIVCNKCMDLLPKKRKGLMGGKQTICRRCRVPMSKVNVNQAKAMFDSLEEGVSLLDAASQAGIATVPNITIQNVTPTFQQAPQPQYQAPQPQYQAPQYQQPAPQMGGGMKYCSSCGQQIPAQSGFCQHCGGQQ